MSTENPVTTNPMDNGRTHEPSLREITAELDGFKALMEERDRLYKERSDAAKDAVSAALAAQKELTNNAFLASEKAIGKAEGAQTDYNLRSNEFRAALDDSNKDKISRIDAERQISAVVQRVDEGKRDFEKYREQQATEIRGLRESRSEGQGAMFSGDRRNAQTGLNTSHIISGISLLIAFAALASRLWK